MIKYILVLDSKKFSQLLNGMEKGKINTLPKMSVLDFFLVLLGYFVGGIVGYIIYMIFFLSIFKIRSTFIKLYMEHYLPYVNHFSIN